MQSMRFMHAFPRIGILGGSFNPVHNDHLALADLAKKNLALDRILFIPNAFPAYKNSVKVSYQDRRSMLEMALIDHGDSDFVIKDLEEDPSRHHYTCETLASLRREYGEATPLFFIMGYDSLLYIDEWKDGLNLQNLANLVCFTRCGFENSTIKPCIRKLLDMHGICDNDAQFNAKLNESCGNILLIKKSLHEISSSLLRTQLSLFGEHSIVVSQYMNKRVVEYALQHRLYEEKAL